MFAVRYIPRKISEISKSDTKVALVGKVIEANEKSFVLDDGTAKAEIQFEGSMKTGSTVRVFGSIDEERLGADIIQNMDGMDLNLVNKVEELYNKAGV
jgi:hypothetical protein